MKSLLQHLLVEAKQIGKEEFKLFRIENRGGITSELKAMLNISSAKELKLDQDSKAKCMSPKGKKEMSDALGLPAGGNVVSVFLTAFSGGGNNNVLSKFAGNAEKCTIMDKDGVQVKLSGNWKSVAGKTASSARCIKFWMQSIAITCGIISVGDSAFEVGIDQSEDMLYIFINN